MDSSHEQHGVDMGAGSQMKPPASSARTAAKAKTREVSARYLQPKAASAQRNEPAAGVPITGRASLAAYSSAGWVELQHPNHAATPLMVHTGSMGGGFFTQTRNTKGRSGPSQPTAARRQELQQQQQQQLMTPMPPPAPKMVQHQQHQQQSAGATVISESIMATPSQCPGSACSSITSNMLHASSMHADHGTAAASAPGAGSHAGLHTPHVFGLSASMGPCPSTQLLGRQGTQSADMTAALLTQSKAAADNKRRAELAAWKQSKQLGHAGSGRGAAKPAVFKEPAPKPTLFKATAATRTAKAAAGAKGSASEAAAPPATATASVAGSATAGPSKAAAASPSAFTGTMATLQQSGGKPRASGKTGRSASRQAAMPPLRLEQAGVGSRPNASPLQLQVPVSPLAAASTSATKIPKLDLSALAQHDSQQQHRALSSRWPASDTADAALPDATPRSVRDAMPSKLPRTPRATTTPSAGYQQGASMAATPEANDRHMSCSDTFKSPWRQQPKQEAGSVGRPVGSAGGPVVPALKLGSLGPASQAAAGGGSLFNRPGSNASCLSARGQSAAAKASQHRSTSAQLPSTPTRASSCSAQAGTPTSSKPQGRTPRGATGAAAAAAAGKPPTPRSLTGSMVAAAAAAAHASKKSEADKADEVRQQLRVLRMQQRQLRHLNARVEAALATKQEKIDASIAAAAAAVVDLSGQLMKAKDQVQQAEWKGKLQDVLQQQLVQLRAWQATQAQHQANVSQLQAACSSALSHVPLLNGAVIGHNQEQPDVQALQRQLQQGMQMLAELQPAVQRLLSGETFSSSGSSTAAAKDIRAARGLVRDGPSSTPTVQESSLQTEGIKVTAALSHDLMAVAAEECSMLQQLSQQLAALSDLQLYANSMQVQLLHLKQQELSLEP